MKQLFRPNTLLLAAMAMAACSDKDMPEGSLLDSFNSQGEAYINISLNTTGGNGGQTRADGAQRGDPFYSDGDANEYKVNSATLFLFKSEKDEPLPSELTFHSAYPLLNDGGTFEYETTAGDASNPANVTQSHIKVVKIDNNNLSSTDKLFAFALVNYNGSLTFTSKGFQIRDLGTTDQVFSVGDAYTKFRDLHFRSHGAPGNNFVMTNAPLYKSSSSYVMDMPKIDNTKVYYSEKAAVDAAKAGNSTVDVFVERMAAKLTVKLGESMKGKSTETNVGSLADNQYVCFNMNLTSDDISGDDESRNHHSDMADKNWPMRWVTGLRANQCYIMRHVTKHTGTGDDYDYLANDFKGSSATFATNRLLETTETGESGSGFYRIFWGEDMKYNFTEDESKTTATGDTYMEVGPQIAIPSQFDYEINGNGYTFENTMNHYGLTQDKTTNVFIRVPFFAGKDDDDKWVAKETFFTIPSNNRDEIFHDIRNTKVKNPNSIQQKIWNIVANTAEYKTWKEGINVSDEDLFTNTTGEKYGAIVMAYAKRMGDENGYFYGHTNNPAFYPAPGCENEDKIYKTVDGKKVITNWASTALTIGFCTAKFILTDKDYKANGLTEEKRTAFYNTVAPALETATNSIGISCYVDGMAYYKVLVRHFSDGEINDYVHDEGATYDKVYPNGGSVTQLAKNYLGRYGVVRNTWYTITLNGIKHIGTSNFPEIKPVPDDEVDAYINTRINVTKWSNRSQTNTL